MCGLNGTLSLALLVVYNPKLGVRVVLSEMWSPVESESRSGCIGVARKVACCGIHPSCLRGPGGGSVLLFLVLLFVLAI